MFEEQRFEMLISVVIDERTKLRMIKLTKITLNIIMMTTKYLNMFGNWE